MTKADLDLYLEMLNRKSEQFYGNEKEQRLISKMAEEAIYRYYNQENL